MYRKISVFCIAAAAAISANAELSVAKLVARQNWPWDATVKAVYVLDGTNTENADVQLVVSNGEDTFEIPFAELSGDVRSVAAGRELSLTWDPSSGETVSAAWLAANKDAVSFSLKLTATWPKYLVLDLSGGADAESWPVTALSERPGCGWTDAYKTTNLVLRHVRVYGGTTFTCGSPLTEWGRPLSTSGGGTAENQVTVTLTNDFYVGVFELTEKQYEQIMGTGEFTATYPTFPKGGVNWAKLRGKMGYSNEATKTMLAQAWPSSTNVQEGTLVYKLQTKAMLGSHVPAGWVFELPTEEQWEFACRAGSTGPWGNGKDSAPYKDSNNKWRDPSADAMAWYPGNSGGARHSVGLKEPNPWDLYDMHGNVSELCIDFHGGGGSATAGTEPRGIVVSRDDRAGWRVIRGGDYNGTVLGITAYSTAGMTNWNGTVAMIRTSVRDRSTSISSNGANIGTRLAVWCVSGSK